MVMDNFILGMEKMLKFVFNNLFIDTAVLSNTYTRAHFCFDCR